MLHSEHCNEVVILDIKDVCRPDVKAAFKSLGFAQLLMFIDTPPLTLLILAVAGIVIVNDDVVPVVVVDVVVKS
jgi:hypothetical protein